MITNLKIQNENPSGIQQLAPKIAVIGIGGAGGNAVNNMISSNLEGCEFLVCNTDAQALSGSLADHKVQLGANITGGLGAGSKPEVGQAAAEESLEDVLRHLDGANMVFVTAGMGGGTGTGAAPVIAKACRQQGILTVGVVTKPFHFEGVHRMTQADKGIEELQQYVDTLIVIPNQNLFRIANEKTTFAEAFKMADSVLQSGVRGVTDLMVRPGLVNLDFADIRTAMLQMGKAMMGTGEASGDKRAIEAAEDAINNPLLDDVSMKGANGVIINVTGGYDMTLFEADEACNRIRDEVDSNANIIFGATFDENMDGMMRVSIVATGIEGEGSKGKIFGGGSSLGKAIETKKIEGSNSNESEVKAEVQAPAPVVEEQVKPATPPQQDRGLYAPSGFSPMVSVPADKNSAPPQSDIMRSLSAKETVQNLKAPSPKPVEDTRQVVKAESMDMFAAQPRGETSDRMSVEPLRGTTYKDSFIPPRPMMPDQSVPTEGIGPHISNFHAKHVTEDVREPRLKLTPPRLAASGERANRSSSLFERITGSVQQHIDSLRDEGALVKSKPLTGGRPETAAPSQKSLNISRPDGLKLDNSKDDLDIPAFLRRQAN
ncbi:MAG: cell division protein FtsZ [Alphaproteobacteria bacterium]|nr:cell division protein FtsZ [Alphaproteobacteria bacterium]